MFVNKLIYYQSILPIKHKLIWKKRKKLELLVLTVNIFLPSFNQWNALIIGIFHDSLINMFQLSIINAIRIRVKSKKKRISFRRKRKNKSLIYNLCFMNYYLFIYYSTKRFIFLYFQKRLKTMHWIFYHFYNTQVKYCLIFSY